MKRFCLVSISCICLTLFSRPAYSEILLVRGEILQFHETRVNDWSSYILIKDSFNKELTFYVNPQITLIRRGSQIEDVGQLTGGMKVTVLYRLQGKEFQASVIQIDGAIRV